MMHNGRNFFTHFTGCFMALFVTLLSACVHEFPVEEGGPIDIQLQVTLSTQEISPYQTIGFNRGLINQATFRRYIVEVYRNTENRSSYDTAPIYRTIVYQAASESESLTIPLSLHADQYKIAVWMDYVDSPELPSLYYLTEHLTAIHLPPPKDYVGDTDMKDCCSGVAEVDLNDCIMQGQTHIVTPCLLERPLAKFMFIATDTEHYINRIMSRSERTVTRSDIENYTARIVYTGYLPNGFNVLTNKPNDSALGYMCATEVHNLPNGEVCLGSDYVLINTHDAAVEAAIIIYDEEGVVVNESPTIRIPLHRNGLTEIREEFFTIENSKGISINPEFQGEYNIYY